MTDEEFETFVEEALEELPADIAEKLDNIAIVIEEQPSKELVQNLGIPAGVELLGLYHGVPRYRRTHAYSLVLPDRITIFRRNVLKAARKNRRRGQSLPDAVKSEVRRTVLHEIGHYFGLSEADLERLGY